MANIDSGAMTTNNGPTKYPQVLSPQKAYTSPWAKEMPKGDITKLQAGAGEALGRPEQLNVRKEHIAAEIAKNEAVLLAESSLSPFVN